MTTPVCVARIVKQLRHTDKKEYDVKGSQQPCQICGLLEAKSLA
jgi:hypothetical protein